MAGDLQEIKIRRAPIELGQFLKLAMAGSGGEVKALIQNGEVLVNGVVERRRSRHLEGGERVEVLGCSFVVAVAAPRA